MLANRTWLHTAQELSAERGVPVAQLHLSRDNLERVLMARLMEPSPEWPAQFLLRCYARASAEFRASPGLKDARLVQHVQAALLYAKELIVSYAGLVLIMDMFPQVGPALHVACIAAKQQCMQRHGWVHCMPACLWPYRHHDDVCHIA